MKTVDGLRKQLLEIVKKVEYYSDPVRYQAMSTKAYQIFKEKVDFDQEETDLRKFLDVIT